MTVNSFTARQVVAGQPADPAQPAHRPRSAVPVGLGVQSLQSGLAQSREGCSHVLRKRASQISQYLPCQPLKHTSARAESTDTGARTRLRPVHVSARRSQGRGATWWTRPSERPPAPDAQQAVPPRVSGSDTVGPGAGATFQGARGEVRGWGPWGQSRSARPPGTAQLTPSDTLCAEHPRTPQ